MLTRLRFKNFKAWKDSGEIRLAPLTVLFGTNSAGKTSIPQLLLLLKQTAESPDRKRPLQLGDSRTLVDVGSYGEAVHGHDVSRPLEFQLGWQLPEPLRVSDPLTRKKFGGDGLEFRAVIRGDKRQQPVVEEMQYAVRDGDEVALRLGMRRQGQGGKFALTSSNYRPVRQAGRPSPLPAPLRFYGFPDEVTAYYQNTAFAADCVLALEHLLRAVYYLGPLREYPRRLYLWSGEVPEHVGEKGDRAVEAILAAGSERTFDFGPKQRKHTLQQLVASRLQSMGLIRSFEVRPLGRHRNEYEVLVRTGPGMPHVKLTDVGFGVSHVLPVIVECFYVPRRSIVVMEQPEIHLHPRVQSELADLFVDAIHAREDGEERRCQFIVESHSEHFLRRLQRRIAENELTEQEAALYFVRSEADGATLEELQLDRFGNIQNWPDDFFGDEMEDLVARSEAQAERAREEEQAP